MLSIVLLLLSSVAQEPQTPRGVIVCGIPDAQTTPLQSSAGYIASLQMHSEDDHGKNTHLCQAEYALQIIRPDGTNFRIDNLAYPSGFFSSDSDWNRPLVFRVDGYSADGKRVFVFIAEGGKYPLIEAEEIDMTTGSRLRAEGADRFLLNKVGASCVSTLHIAGTASNGHIVLETHPSNACSRTESWQLNAYRRLKKSLGSIPGIPMRLSPGTRIAGLDPGRPIRPSTD